MAPQGLHLMCLGLVEPLVAGTSIGAVVGGCYVANRIEHLREFALGLTRRKVFGYFDLNLSGSGLINGQKLNDVLRKENENSIDDGDEYLRPLNMMPAGEEIPPDPKTPGRREEPPQPSSATTMNGAVHAKTV